VTPAPEPVDHDDEVSCPPTCPEGCWDHQDFDRINYEYDRRGEALHEAKDFDPVARLAADQLSRLGQDMRLDEDQAERAHTVCSQCRIDGTCVNDSEEPTASLRLMRLSILQFAAEKAADRLGQDMRETELEAAHAQLRAQAEELDRLRGLLSEPAACAAGRLRERADEMEAQR
jgi:hypothetical protein